MSILTVAPRPAPAMLRQHAPINPGFGWNQPAAPVRQAPPPPPLLATLAAAPIPLPRPRLSRSTALLTAGGVVTVVNCLALVALYALGLG